MKAIDPRGAIDSPDHLAGMAYIKLSCICFSFADSVACWGCVMQREEIIEALVVDCLVNIFDRNQYCWLQDILENGFRGFARMSTEELHRELSLRRLDVGIHPDVDAWIESDDCAMACRDLPAMNDRRFPDEA